MSRTGLSLACRIISCLWLIAPFGLPPALCQRTFEPLDEGWQFRRDKPGASWKTVDLPATMEQHEGTDFDGVGIYRRRIPSLDVPETCRVLLHCQAIATHAEVFLDGKKIGEHLGGWTPFRFDVTEALRGRPSESHLLEIRVDERVGHNSQGFLPVIAPHFGGIWQPVGLVITSATYVDDLSLLAVGEPRTGNVRLEFSLRGERPTQPSRMIVRHRLRGTSDWSEPRTFTLRPNEHGLVRLNIPIPHHRLWSPKTPALYELELRLAEHETLEEPLIVRAAFRDFRTDGNRFLLNGKPISLRGVLNWGYAPPGLAPSLDESWFRKELELARSYGFNMMKFCLWVPPQRYLDLADELGVLTWIEYPTWHSKWSPDQLPTLRREFLEFFHYDRNHPSIVLRSLTCETGPSADLGVIRNLYDLCHEKIPGSVVEDDSSWIAWNRVHDFYDDHPYGNNHTWVATLDRLKQHIARHGTKPLVLGEAIAADTWVSPKKLIDTVGTSRPFWVPRFLDGNTAWLDTMRRTPGANGLRRLSRESRHYAMLMRKYQIEAYRREVPEGGYVVSVIRDFPLAAMGLVDYFDRPKWPAGDWSWHGDTMLLLQTADDRRSLTGGTVFSPTLLVSHFGETAWNDAKLRVSLEPDVPLDRPRAGRRIAGVDTACDIEPGRVTIVCRPEIRLPSVGVPTRCVVKATLQHNGKMVENRWPIWILPPQDAPSAVMLHPSCDRSIRDRLPRAVAWTGGTSERTTARPTVVARRFDAKLLEHLLSGGRVLLLPDGEKGSLPLASEWFLRGAPYIADHRLLKHVPRKMLLELQHFDLADRVVPDVGYLDEIDPIVMLWHNHDIERVKTHGLLFETRVGRGRLLVSALRHDGEGNAAGAWLLGALLRHLRTGPSPERALSDATVGRMRDRIDERVIDLTARAWQFRPDPKNDGRKRGWQRRALPASERVGWRAIRIGRAWEGLGYPTLDGWAWYRTVVHIPKDWPERMFVCFTGVDDHYELYVNGTLAGSGGDIATKRTAFEERSSHDITQRVERGRDLVIAVRVYDWYGAGGIFRPVSLRSSPLGVGRDVLR